MRIHRFGIAALALGALAACASPTRPVEEARQRVDETRPICVSPRDCDAKWAAAREWIAGNADYAIQRDTGVRIDTVSKGGEPTDKWAVVSRKPLGIPGQYLIDVALECTDHDRCPRAELVRAMQHFNDIVGQAGAKRVLSAASESATP
ncbi:MAG: hypothetical protein ABW136_08395 [Steroidobacteraceae bacterium]